MIIYIEQSSDDFKSNKFTVHCYAAPTLHDIIMRDKMLRYFIHRPLMANDFTSIEHQLALKFNALSAALDIFVHNNICLYLSCPLKHGI